MTRSIVRKVLSQTDAIYDVTFTGGEPSLNVELIKYFIEEVSKRKIPVNSFWVATNGAENTLELVHALLDLYYYCGEDGDDLCCVALSRDKYHDNIPPKNEMLLEGLGFYDGSREYTDAKEKIRNIQNTGRANQNGLGNWNKEYAKYIGYEVCGDDILTQGDV
jgi:hypothetical protein